MREKETEQPREQAVMGRVDEELRLQCARRSARNWPVVKSGTVLGSIRGGQDQLIGGKPN